MDAAGLAAVMTFTSRIAAADAAFAQVTADDLADLPECVLRGIGRVHRALLELEVAGRAGTLGRETHAPVGDRDGLGGQDAASGGGHVGH